MNFAFWDLNKKQVLPHLVSLVQLHDIDVLILAESSLVVADVLYQLNGVQPALRGRMFHYLEGTCKRIHLFARFSRSLSNSKVMAPTSRYVRSPLLQRPHLLLLQHISRVDYTGA